MKKLLEQIAAVAKKLGRKFALALLAVILAFSLQPSAFAQTTSPTLFVLTNIPATTVSNVLTYMTNIVPLTKNCGLSLAFRSFTTAGGGNELFYGSFSSDGTNFGMFPFTVASGLTTTGYTNGSGPIFTGFTNFSQSSLNGLTAVNIYAVTNTSPGTATNLAAVANRPTLNTLTY